MKINFGYFVQTPVFSTSFKVEFQLISKERIFYSYVIYIVAYKSEGHLTTGKLFT